MVYNPAIQDQLFTGGITFKSAHYKAFFLMLRVFFATTATVLLIRDLNLHVCKAALSKYLSTKTFFYILLEHILETAFNYFCPLQMMLTQLRLPSWKLHIR